MKNFLRQLVTLFLLLVFSLGYLSYASSPGLLLHQDGICKVVKAHVTHVINAVICMKSFEATDVAPPCYDLPSIDKSNTSSYILPVSTIKLVHPSANDPPNLNTERQITM